jgi:hypothetical protein
MCSGVYRIGWAVLLCTAAAFGCSKTSERPAIDEEGAVRKQFAELQTALRMRDAEKLWMLLDSRSHADAERAAKAARTAYADAKPEEKADREKALGLTGAELAGLTGKGYLKTKRFQDRYQEVPDSKIDKVVVQGDSATVHYLEPDGENEKAILVRQDGQWKVWLTIPKYIKP